VSAAPEGPVTTWKVIALVVLVAMGAMLLQPGQAEAIEPLTAITIAGAAVLVVTVVVVLIIANMRDRERGEAAEPTVVAFDAGGVQGL
jgi:membrane protein YdbS with pleckstrin-like domain